MLCLYSDSSTRPEREERLKFVCGNWSLDSLIKLVNFQILGRGTHLNLYEATGAIRNVESRLKVE